MKTYGFTLILSGVEVMTEQLANDLYEAGCDDGTPASGNGLASIAFDREANSLEEAIGSAIADVEKAGVIVDHAELDNEELALLRA